MLMGLKLECSVPVMVMMGPPRLSRPPGREGRERRGAGGEGRGRGGMRERGKREGGERREEIEGEKKGNGEGSREEEREKRERRRRKEGGDGGGVKERREGARRRKERRDGGGVEERGAKTQYHEFLVLSIYDVNDVTLRPHPLTREDSYFRPQGADDLIQSPFSVHHSIYTTL